MGRAGRAAGARGARDMSGRRAGARAATQPRGCCDTAPVRTVRAAWAPGLALGSALGPFSIRFDSFFFFLSHQMNTVHCKIKFFSKIKYLLNSNKIK